MENLCGRDVALERKRVDVPVFFLAEREGYLLTRKRSPRDSGIEGFCCYDGT